jgi:hypothetical protein
VDHADGGYEKRVKGILSEGLHGRDHVTDVGIDGRMLLKLILKETGCECVNWT